jgi:enamine deaminase RidA (YjgF/YER057c/UK114 family)
MARPTARQLISTGSPFEDRNAYSRAVAQGNWCFVAGTTGFDYATMTMPESAGAQTRATLSTISDALAQASFALEDVVRVHYHVADPNDIDEISPVLREFFSEIRPAATMVISQLIDPAMKIEIEVTALRG